MKIKKTKSAFSLIEISVVLIIIGILIAGITQGGRLITKMKLAAAQSMTNDSPVLSTPNLVLWYETTGDVSFDDADKEDGNPVSKWYDINLSANFKTNASSSGGARPTYKENCINKLPCLYFDSNNSNYMDTTNLGVSTQFSTYFMVLKLLPNSTETYSSLLMTQGIWDSSSGLTHFQIRYGSDQNKFQFASEGGSQEAISTNALNENTDYILGAIDNGSTISLYKNGVLDASVITTPSNKSLGILNIASFNEYSRARFFNGYIAEIIVFNRALKEEERKSIESYLSKKWGIKTL